MLNTTYQTRIHFARNAIGCIREVLDGKVYLNESFISKEQYRANKLADAKRIRAGGMDHTMTFQQYKHYLDTGNMVALLP